MQNNIIEKVRQTIKRYRLFKSGESIIIGVSGGPDSVALLTVLDRINRRYGQNWRLTVAHLNHQIRGREAARDEKFVRALGRELGYPVRVKKVNVPALARREKLSLEQAARQARYDFFYRLFRALKISTIAVGHHLDDHVETILFRIIRGCGLRGLGGIRPARPLFYNSPVKLVRPLIETTRDEIMSFLKKGKIAYQLDRTNLDKKIIRNRIRLELIPYLQKYNPQVKNSLVRLAAIAGVACDYLDQESRKHKIKKTDDLGKLHPALQTTLMEKVIQGAGIPLKEFTSAHYRRVLKLLRKQGRDTETFLPGGVIARKEDRGIGFYRGTGKSTNRPRIKVSPAAIKIPGKTRLPPYRLAVRTSVLNSTGFNLPEFIKTKTPDEEVFDFDKIKKPLSIRYPRPGDRFQPLGVKGSQSLKKFFIDHKIPQAERRVIPLIVSGGRIIWVAGCRLDGRFKVTGQTKKILKIWIRPNKNNS